MSKMRAKWFRRLVAVSRFFCFPIQMNFAECEKWPASPVWRATHKKSVGGYVRGGKAAAGNSQSNCAYSKRRSHRRCANCTLSCRPPLRVRSHKLAGFVPRSRAVHSGWSTPTKAAPPGARRTGDAWNTAAGACPDRCRMGSVDGWPLVTPETRATGGNHAWRTPQW